MRTKNTSAPEITRERAQRIIHAYASVGARIMAHGYSELETECRLDQKRRQLAVRLWRDITDTDWWGLVRMVADLRAARTAGWDANWESPGDKDAWVTTQRDLIRTEVQALAWPFPKAA